MKIREMNFRASCTEADLNMADGKMVAALLQLGGAYFTMCTRGQEECKDVKVVIEGLLIDRDIESVTDLALSLEDPETRELVRNKQDYRT